MLKLPMLGAFILSDVFLLICMLSGGILIFTALSGEPTAFTLSLFSRSEVIRAFGVAAIFMTFSGYIVSIVIVTVIFRARLLSFARASWLVLLFVLHAGMFVFYLRAPGVYTSSALLISVGVVCVFAVTALEYFLWRGRLLSAVR